VPANDIVAWRWPSQWPAWLRTAVPLALLFVLGLWRSERHVAGVVGSYVLWATYVLWLMADVVFNRNNPNFEGRSRRQRLIRAAWGGLLLIVFTIVFIVFEVPGLWRTASN
jgi:hypothetical protein